MNFVHIVGRLGRDPETRYTAEGLKVTVLVVATNSRKGGNEETIWWRVTLWGDRWDKMVPHLKKGKPIMVGGDMRKPEIYTDKNGQPQIGSIEVSADYVKFVPFGRTEGAESEHTQMGNVEEPAGVDVGAFSEPGSATAEAAAGLEGGEEEPLPF